MRMNRTDGFTLVELAVVLAIVGLMLGGLMYTLSAQTEQRNFEETRRRLEQARELLLSYAIVNGRLPCPASSTSNGYEDAVAGTGACNVPGPYGGWLPARTIGVQQIDTGGYAIDVWGNRIRYAVAVSTTPSASCPTPHFTGIYASTTNGLKTNGISCQPDDLLVCNSATGITAANCGGQANQVMTKNLVVAVIFSTGKNGASGSAGIDEAANLDGDPIFVSHTPAPTSATNGEFDDQLTWITVGELYGRLVSAGVLP